MNEILTILGALEAAGVRFVVAGGVAVVLHGYPRLTADLDIVLDLERDNVLRAVGALEELGYHPRAPVAAKELASQEIRERWIREKGMKVFSLWSTRLKGTEIDIFAEEPFPFAEGYDRAQVIQLEGITFRIVSLEDLIEMKAVAGRDKDVLDLKMLRRLQQSRDARGPC
ncbi:MAG: nucleotidyltransferase [Acidobacteria bacterium]|nr:nucleotidyltransferase [Acidobacteriota bacterium]